MQELSINERDVFIDMKVEKTSIEVNIKLKQCLRKGDLLYIKSIDRFGRNSKEIKREWEDITQNIKADIKVIDMPLLDTTQYKDQLGNFVSELILQVLAFVSERERDNILQRQSEGIAFAKAKGKHLGRPQLNLSTISKQQRQILEKLFKMEKIKRLQVLGLWKC